MSILRILGPSIVCALAVMATAPAATSETSGTAMKPAPQFTEAFLSDPAKLQAGLEVWQDQCRHCHGKSAYPGKAPKLRPRRYTPDFVFDRVTNGFRKMPAWGEVYSQDERMAVVAYILSKKFAP